MNAEGVRFCDCDCKTTGKALQREDRSSTELVAEKALHVSCELYKKNQL